MPTTKPTTKPTAKDIQCVFDLGQQYQAIAEKTFALATQNHPVGSPEFNDAYCNYTAVLQKARDMYYAAAHLETGQIASCADLEKLLKATRDLQTRLGQLQKVENVVKLGLQILATIGTVTAAVLDPCHAETTAAVTSVTSLVGAIITASPPKAC